MPYLTPDELPEEDACRPLLIPDDTAWLALVSGALTELTQPYNWQQFGAVTVEQAVARMQKLLDDYYDVSCTDCTLPGGEKIIQIGTDGHFYEACGSSWCEPTGDYALPPVPAREEPTADERKCLAARNAAHVMQLLYEDMTDNYNLDIDPAVALTSWVGVQSTVVLVALGFLSFSVGTVLFGMWTLMYQALEFLTEDVWDSGFTEKLTCALYQCADENAGVVTFNYKCFMDKLAYGVDLGDPSIGELRLYAQVQYMMFFLGIDGVNHAGATTAITEYDCSCAGCASLYEDFDGGLLQPFTTIGDDVPILPSSSYRCGAVNDTVGRTATGSANTTSGCSGTNARLMVCLDFGRECDVSSIAFYTRTSAALAGAGLGLGVGYYDESGAFVGSTLNTAVTSNTSWALRTSNSDFGGVRYVIITLEVALAYTAFIDDIEVIVL